MRGGIATADLIYDRANDSKSLALVNEVVKTDLRYLQQSLNLLRDKHMIPRDLTIPKAALETSIRLMRNAHLLDAHTLKDPHGAIDDSYRLEALM